MTLRLEKPVLATQDTIIDCNEFVSNARALNERALKQKIQISENEFLVTTRYPNGKVKSLVHEDAEGNKNGLCVEFDATNTTVTKFGYYENNGEFDQANVRALNHGKLIKSLLS